MYHNIISMIRYHFDITGLHQIEVSVICYSYEKQKLYLPFYNILILHVITLN